MAHTIKQLGQARPTTTAADSLFSPASGEEAIVHNVVICNTTSTDATYRLFLDDDGAVYDEASALVWDSVCPANETVLFEVKLTMNNASGNLGYATGTGSALTFTANGEVFS